jgi:hypothetical protein
MCCVAAHQPDGHRALAVQAVITGSTLRVILRLHSLQLGAQRVGARNSLFLLPHVLPFVPWGHSENCSIKLSRIRVNWDDNRGVAQHRGHRRRQRKCAGRILETPGSTCD